MEEKGKTNLLGFTREQLADFVEDIGEPRYRAQQIFEWLYTRGATEFRVMTNLGKAFRAQLERAAVLQGITPVHQTHSAHDGTTKFPFELPGGLKIESVLIPPATAFRDTAQEEDDEQSRLTLCVSTQVGCPLDCAFCATGTMGFFRNLTTGEIVDQVLQVKRLSRRKITNVVFMGMGEPLLNYDRVMAASGIIAAGIGIALKRITVSTVGIPQRIRRLGDEERRMKLAISLHSAVDATRSRLMPINRRFPLAHLMEAVEYYYAKTGERVTYEFIFFDGVNDTEREVKAFIKLARRVPCKINVIPYHSIAFTSPSGLAASLRPSPRVEELVRELREHHLTTMIRSSAGEDIDAACGQLAVRLARTGLARSGLGRTRSARASASTHAHQPSP
ncbi:MAG TPA: 23S rRNA (adenine(2503)-C(2))-methyltransferase RlmN [Bacteroidota bacterium]